MKITMKNFSIAAFSVAIIVMLLLIQSCKEVDPTPKATDQVSELLKANTWKMQSVLVDGVDKTSVYAGLTLSFTATNYTSTKGGAVWPATGTWSFADDTGKLINRNDGVLITVEEINATKLSLKLNWAKTILGGRTTSVAGNHTFVFGK